MSNAKVPTLSADAVEMRDPLCDCIGNALEKLRYITAINSAVAGDQICRLSPNVMNDPVVTASISALVDCAQYLTEEVTRELNSGVSRAWDK